MPTDDEIKIILDVLGTEKVENAKKAIQQEEEAIRQFSAQLKAGAISQAQFDAAAGRSAQAIQAASAQIQSATRGLNPQAILEVSRAVEDFSFAGINGVVNNIPSIVQALGGGPGLAGVASFLAVGLGLATRNWDSLMAALGQSKTLSEAGQMDELAKATNLAADAAERLGRYQAIGAKTEEIQSGKTEAQQATEAATTKAIVEAGSEDVARGLLKADPTAFDAAIPGITDKEGNLIQNVRGENRTAVTDARDARQALDDYVSGKSRRETLAKGETITHDVKADELQRLQTAAAEAEKRLAEARTEAASREAAKGALPKYFPGGTDQLREKIEADPDAFGPGGARLAKALKDAANPEYAKDVEDDKAERADRANAEDSARLAREVAEWAKETGHDPKTGEKILYGGAKEEAEETDEQYELRRQAKEKEYQDKLAQWAFEGDKKLQDETDAAKLQDKMTEFGKEWARTHQSAQVFSGPAALRDAIQQAQRKDNDPTAVETLKAQREAIAEIKRSNEQLATIARRVGGPARAG